MRDHLLRGQLICVVIVSALWLAVMPQFTAIYAQGETLSCNECHVDVCESFHKTPHGKLSSDIANVTGNICESCHGPGAAHIESGDPTQIVNPAKADSFGDVESCLSCHKEAQFDDWVFSSHRSEDVSCSSCHKVHGGESNLATRDVSELCYGCHGNVRAAASMPSHHPIAEGKVSCIDCHNPHGGGPTLAVDNTGRELCFGCHADKEGPFVYEHAPVNEDCMICHQPHGSVADNLLKQSEPTLCLSCHSMHFHATAEGVDGEFTVPLDPTRNGVSNSDGWKLGFLTKCTQCHTATHGTDLPSEALSTGGNALTR